MTIHVLRVPTHVTSAQIVEGERWCFYCRKRQPFTLTIWAPDDPMSYYGPHAELACPHGHRDGDCFPSTYRDWSEHP